MYSLELFSISTTRSTLPLASVSPLVKTNRPTSDMLNDGMDTSRVGVSSLSVMLMLVCEKAETAVKHNSSSVEKTGFISKILWVQEVRWV